MNGEHHGVNHMSEIDLDHLSSQLGEVLSDVPFDEVYLVGSFADPDKEVDRDGEKSDVDVYIDAEVSMLWKSYQMEVWGRGGESLGVRDIEIFTQKDMGEDAKDFEDGLEKFPESIKLGVEE